MPITLSLGKKFRCGRSDTDQETFSTNCQLCKGQNNAQVGTITFKREKMYVNI